MKKIISIIMVLSLMLSGTMTARAAEIDPNDEIRKAMISYGMPEEIVNALPDSEIAKYANIEQDSTIKRYYRFTENEAGVSAYSTAGTPAYTVEEVTEAECMAALAMLDAVQPYGTIKESYMETTINASHIEGRRYLISATYHWLSTPVFKSKDYFALTIHDCMVLVPDTEYTLEQNDYVSIFSGSTINTNSWTDSLQASGIGGHCMSMEWIPDDDYTTYFNFRGYMSFEAEIAEVGPNGKINFVAYIAYAHQTLLPTFGVTISLPKSVSATISPKRSFDYLTNQGNWTHTE